MALRLGDRIDFDGAEDGGKGDEEVGAVFVVVFVEGEVFRSEDYPGTFPLAYPAFGPQVL